MFFPRPESRHEYALSRIMTSWWTFAGSFVAAATLIGLSIVVQASGRNGGPIAIAFFVLGLLIVVTAIMSRRSTSWSITS